MVFDDSAVKIKYQFNQVPLVIVIFNRPALTQKLFEVIRIIQPETIFLVADGPRESVTEDVDKCTQARSIFSTIDWPCQVSKNFSEVNLGCRKRISSGLDWVFSQVEEAIILEDDCVPSVDFFKFCQYLLSYYRDDERVWVISGNNFQNNQWRGDGSYYFSRYPHCWGWATWKRAWQHYDDRLGAWSTLKNSGLLASIFEDPLEIEYWTQIFDRLVATGKPDSWAYRWAYTCWINSGLTILPNVNLVSNIGFSEESTHTKNMQSPLAHLPAQTIGEIMHPSFVIRDRKADAYTFDFAFGGKNLRRQKRPHNRLKNLLKSFLKRVFPKLINQKSDN